MKLAGVGKLYSILYDDKIVIYRTTTADEDDGSTSMTYSSTPVAEVPGRISFSSDDRSSDKDVDRSPVLFYPKIFCSPHADLRAGDFVKVYRHADSDEWEMVYKGTLAMPSRYSTHQEAFIRVDEGA